MLSGLGCASAAAKKATAKKSPDLLSQIQGARTPGGALIIDEATGRMGAIHLGMSLGGAEAALPREMFASSLNAGQDASYCSAPTGGGHCRRGVVLWVFGACAIGFPTSANCGVSTTAGPVAVINLITNGDPRKNQESSEAVTLRGLRLGSPMSDVLRLYRNAKKRSGTCQAGPFIFGNTKYVTLTGKSVTLVISVSDGTVIEISLIEGRHPNLCR